MGRYFPPRTWQSGGRYFRNFKDNKIDVTSAITSIRNISLGAPNPGANYPVVPVPVGYQWVLTGFGGDFITDGTAVNRAFIILIQNSAAQDLTSFHAASNQAASLTRRYRAHLGSNGYITTGGVGFGTIGIPLGRFVMENGMRVAFHCDGLQAGDQFTVASITVEETAVQSARTVEQAGPGGL